MECVQAYDPIPAMENRYSQITEKNPREIVMLRGDGCKWRRCRFCDYHLDFHPDERENFTLNEQVLSRVTGCFGRLEVINSGSFSDLDDKTRELIRRICVSRQIRTLHIESHWKHRHELIDMRHYFAEYGIMLKIKTGVESFDYLFRESYLVKGIPDLPAKNIAAYFDEVCLLFGLPGQTVSSMWSDIETGLLAFERVCINIFCQNTTPIMPDKRVVKAFLDGLYPLYHGNPRVDILLQNTDFGVGGKTQCPMK